MFEGTIAGNELREFDPIQRERLGSYVYALEDPRDGKIFYVGQGKNNRLFDHFSEAQVSLDASKNASSKVIRILDIWKNGEDVGWHIVAHGLPEESLDFVESAVIDSLLISQNGQCLNKVRGPRSSLLTSGEVSTLGASRINPDSALQRVFIFPIHNALTSSRDNIYEATRASWNVTDRYREGSAHAVGIQNGISVGGYSIERWEERDGKFAFTGTEDPMLINFDWKYVISQAKGFWQRGNYLIAEFDGNGQFRILRGGGTNNDWLSCTS